MPALRHDDVMLRLIRDVEAIRSVLRRVTVNLPLFDVANENTPDAFYEDQDDYVLGNYDVLRVSSSSAISITGLAGGIKGRFIRLFNIGDYPITLEYQNASSSAENRFQFSNGENATLQPKSNMNLYYDSSLERWIGADTYSSGAVFASLTNSVPQSIPDGDTPTQLDLDTVIADEYDFFDDVNDRIVFPTDGFYHATLQGDLDEEFGAGGYHRKILIRAFDTSDVQIGERADTKPQDAQDHSSYCEANYYDFFSEGEYLEFYALQRSPTLGATNIRNVFVNVTKTS